MLCVAGKPYDTLEEVIGISGEAGRGSLKDFGVGYREVALRSDGSLDIDAALRALSPRVKLALIQRSRGYDWRPSLSVEQIDAAARAIHEARRTCA